MKIQGRVYFSKNIKGYSILSFMEFFLTILRKLFWGSCFKPPHPPGTSMVFFKSFRKVKNQNIWFQDNSIIEDPSVSKFIEFIPSQNKWKCSSCSRLFSTSFNVANHIKQKHRRGATADQESETTDQEESDDESHD